MGTARLATVTITVQDMARSAKFYREVVGLQFHSYLYVGRPRAFFQCGEILLCIREDAVRQQIGHAIEADPTLTRLTADAVNDSDIHAACLAVVECSDLSEEQGAAEFRAALAAIREAEQRLAPVG